MALHSTAKMIAPPERPNALIFRHAGCKRPLLLTSKTNERDNARL